MTRYTELYGMALARAHANTGSAAAVAGYFGKSDRFDESLGRFALTYAEQTIRDHAALLESIDTGRVQAVVETG